MPNAYKLVCFDRNNGNRDVKFLECDYLLVQRCVKLTLPKTQMNFVPFCVWTDWAVRAVLNHNQ